MAGAVFANAPSNAASIDLNNLLARPRVLTALKLAGKED